MTMPNLICQPENWILRLRYSPRRDSLAEVHHGKSKDIGAIKSELDGWYTVCLIGICLSHFRPVP
jgi:hypothetical protein